VIAYNPSYLPVNIIPVGREINAIFPNIIQVKIIRINEESIALIHFA